MATRSGDAGVSWRTVFVTVGTTKFDKLMVQLFKEDTLRNLQSLGCLRLVVQTGSSVVPSHATTAGDIAGLTVETFRYKDSIADDIRNADVIVSHAGAGTMLDVLHQNKPLIVLINSSLMNNHQIELASIMKEAGHLLYSQPEGLSDVLLELNDWSRIPLPPSKPTIFSNFMDKVILGK